MIGLTLRSWAIRRETMRVWSAWVVLAMSLTGIAGDETVPSWRKAVAPRGVPGPELTLAADGRALYTILMPAGAEGDEKLAARKLAYYLGRMAGAKFDVIEEGTASPGDKVISVGRTKLLEAAKLPQAGAKLGPAGYAIAAQGERLFLFGSVPKGTLNGVYCLLEEDLGCRWYSVISDPVIPRRRTLRFRPSLRQYAPALTSVRYVHGMASSYNDEWKRANRHKDYTQDHPWGFSHTYARLVPRGFFKEHPEYFRERNGKRSPVQICPMNRDVEQIILTKVLDHHKKNRKKDRAPIFYEISPNDTRNNCECKLCKPLIDANGGTHMAPLLDLLNRIATKATKTYPEIHVTTLAYLETVPAPTNMKPHKNVVIALATDRVMWAWPQLLISETPRDEFRTAIKAWRGLGANLRIWDYSVVYQYLMQPLPNILTVAQNMRYYLRYGVSGIFMQMAHGPDHGADRMYKRAWVWQKLMWDPSRNARDLVREFNEGYYGPAAPMLQEYDELMWRLHDRHHMNYLQSGESKMRLEVLYDGEFLDEATSSFRRARQAVKDDPILLKRVCTAMLNVQYLRLNQGPGDDPAGYQKVLDDFTTNSVDSAVSWASRWAGESGCGPRGDAGARNKNYDHRALAIHPWKDKETGWIALSLKGRQGLTLNDLIDQWSGDQRKNAGLVLKADAASEASVRNRLAWDSAETKVEGHRPRLTVQYTPRDGRVRKTVIFEQGASNALTSDYEGFSDFMLAETMPFNNHAVYRSNGAGSMGWAHKNTPVRSLMRWDLSAMAGQYGTIHAVTVSVHAEGSKTGTLYVYSISDANARWRGSKLNHSVGKFENMLVRREDRADIIELWQGLAKGQVPKTVEAARIAADWRYRYDTTGRGDKDRWFQTNTDTRSWKPMSSGTPLRQDQAGTLWIRGRVSMPGNMVRNNNYMTYFPSVVGGVQLYLGEVLQVDRTVCASGFSREKLETMPLLYSAKRGFPPGQRPVMVTLRIDCTQGLATTWKPAYLVSTPARLVNPAIDQVLRLLKLQGKIKVGKIVRVVGELTLPQRWTVFAPGAPRPGKEQLKAIPRWMGSKTRKIAPTVMTAKNGHLDLTPILNAVIRNPACIYVPFETDKEETVTFGVGADWWFTAWLDGERILDTSKYGNDRWPPSPADHRKAVHLSKGKHLLVVYMQSGTGSSQVAIGGPSAIRTAMAK